MNINFEYHAVKASNRLEILAADKLDKLLGKFDFVVRADVFLKTENTSQPDTGMICGIRLSTPGPRLFAESSNGNFEASIAETVTELERQLNRRKAKMKTY
jgi:putative sigma-54 modulation protein